MIIRSRIAFRPETAKDAAFVLRLYASTRDAEMKMVPWSEQEKEIFVRQQFEAQAAHYREHYHDADFNIITLDSRPIGRLYLHVHENDLRIIDITLAPEMRGQGIGAMLLGELLERAAGDGRTVSIHVEQFNPALHLYRRLGFSKVSSYGVYDLMEWRPVT